MEEGLDKKDELVGLRPPILFAPDVWGQIRKFRRFYRPTYPFNRKTESALFGADGHFEKYMTLKGICKRLIPELDKDHKELTEKGYSETIHHAELAAIIDSLFCELYSSVDCTRTVIVAVYGRYRGIGIDKKSTSGLFKNAGNHIIDERVPLEIRKSLENGQNDWFPRLKEIRDAINHSNIGSCSSLQGRKSGEKKISYFHNSLGNDEGNVLVTDDVFKLLSEFEVKVNMFLGSVYHALNQTLEDKETAQVCGFFNGRVYLRLVSPYEAIDFNSGRCLSRKWFYMEDKLTCPYVDICGAYLKSENMDKTN